MPDLKSLVVVKSNSLVTASYRLSVNEQRIFLACIGLANRTGAIADDIFYSVSVADVVSVTGAPKSITYRDLKKAAAQLRRREVSIYHEPNTGKKHNSVVVCGWVQACKYVESEGRVALKFSNDILPYLSGLSERFTQYKLGDVSGMDSAYAIRLYELLISWFNSKYPNRKTEPSKQLMLSKTVELDWLRETLQTEDKYPATKDFIKRVVEVAVSQITEYSDIKAGYTTQKTGRSITHVTLTVTAKENLMDSAPTKARPPKTTDKLIYGVPESEIMANAKPGETHAQAAIRISQAKGKASKKAADSEPVLATRKPKTKVDLDMVLADVKVRKKKA